MLGPHVADRGSVFEMTSPTGRGTRSMVNVGGATLGRKRGVLSNSGGSLIRNQGFPTLKNQVGESGCERAHREAGGIFSSVVFLLHCFVGGSPPSLFPASWLPQHKARQCPSVCHFVDLILLRCDLSNG